MLEVKLDNLQGEGGGGGGDDSEGEMCSSRSVFRAKRGNFFHARLSVSGSHLVASPHTFKHYSQV